MLSVGGIAAFLVLLAVLITVHELGHLLVAKACGVKVLTFSIGFGPRLVGFRIGDTDYRISILPLGGYVKMHGDDISQEVPPEEEKISFLTQPFWKKSAIAVAGPLANLLLPLPLFFLLTFGASTLPAPVVGTVLQGGPAAQAGIQSGDRILNIDGKDMRSFGDVAAVVTTRAGVPLSLTVERNGQTQNVTVVPQPSPAPEILDADRKVGRIGFMSSVAAPIVAVIKDSPAARAGVRADERIVAVNGQAVASRQDVESALWRAGNASVLLTLQKKDEQKRDISLQGEDNNSAPAIAESRFAVTQQDRSQEKVSRRVADTRSVLMQNLGSPLSKLGLLWAEGRVREVQKDTAAAELDIDIADIVVAIDGESVVFADQVESALRAAPDDVHVLGLRRLDGSARVSVFRMAPAPERQWAGIKVLGIQLESAMDAGPSVQVHIGVVEAAKRAVLRTVDTLFQVVHGLLAFVTGKVGLAGLGGPVTMYKITNDVVVAGADGLLWWAAMLTVNLCVINLLPVPILDGGHLLIFLVEAIRRKRLSIQARIRATQAGLLFVVALMVVALSNDVLNFL